MAYFRLDLKEHVFSDLEDIPERLVRYLKNPSGLKWVILTADSALYHSMVLALRNSDGSGIWEKPEPRDPVGHINPFHPKAKLLGFHTALDAVQDPVRMGGYIGAKPLAISLNEVKKLRGHHKNRNAIVHYTPISWSIHVLVVIEHILAALPVIKFLLLDSGRVLLEEEEIYRLRGIISKIRSVIAANPVYQEHEVARNNGST